MENVFVTVIGTQKDGYGEKDRIELATVGQSYQKNGIHYITYRESAISGMEGSTTVLKLYPDHITLVRMGNIEHKQEFRLGQRSHSTYITPFGSLKMSVLTKKLQICRRENQTVVHITYELAINGEWQSDNTLSVTIREESGYGH